jgi:nitrogen fixation NifU-like protein
MLFDDDDLYQELIMDHNRHPRNFHDMPNATHHADGNNPLCGDKIKVFLDVQNDRIENISFCGSGCAISQASASLMTEAIKGQPVQRAHELFEAVHHLLTADDSEIPADLPDKVMALSGVKAFPMRVKCATLSWHTMLSALEHGHNEVSSEQ